ncbi:glycosyl hydrolase family 61-domain-containing protein [Xylaria castorea]|nr:glycosyl hydrolase family 61-domain-containing protein [Xylaria castorea]
MLRHTLITSVLACLRLVAGHGGGQHYTIDGVVYRGNWDFSNNTEGSIQRDWHFDYVIDLDDKNMACGNSGKPSAKSYYAPIKAGNIVSVNYTLYETYGNWLPGDHWGHTIGPMSAYMAACPDEGCEGVDVNAPIWFKIWETGLLNGTWVDGYWAQKDVNEGANLDIPTPASLKPGKYLMRHEMTNLENAFIQWFPNCVQLEVSGSGHNLPATEELVAFPGAYDKDVNKSFVLTYAWAWFYTDHANDTVSALHSHILSMVSYVFRFIRLPGHRFGVDDLWAI